MDKVLLSFQSYNNADLRFIDQLIHVLSEQPDGIQMGYNSTQTSVIDVGLCITATQFLHSDFDFLLSIDYDILMNPWQDPAYKWGSDIKRIIESTKETGGLVAGPYLIRGTDKLCATIPEGGEIIIGPGGGIKEVQWVPTGFTCISKKLIQDMAATLPLAEYDDKTLIYPFFLPYLWKDPSNGKLRYLSLDFAFSQRARDIGYKVYLDTRIVLGHIGQKIYFPKPADDDPTKDPRP